MAGGRDLQRVRPVHGAQPARHLSPALAEAGRPDRERLVAALHRDGRLAEALETYRTAPARLALRARPAAGG
ncbi:hypothetical protein ACFFSH_26305 [Streptomyces filamentosus]|uniref:hypothetical protein n=1 Tax=Streptomyces filamentosus TaxID=67294 RepID=UPI00167BC481|nr:hypothetical protein [Streptomyces filamentosus]